MGAMGATGNLVATVGMWNPRPLLRRESAELNILFHLGVAIHYGRRLRLALRRSILTIRYPAGEKLYWCGHHSEDGEIGCPAGDLNCGI